MKSLECEEKLAKYLPKLPAELASADNSAVLVYLRSIKSGRPPQHVNRAKLIFVGYLFVVEMAIASALD